MAKVQIDEALFYDLLDFFFPGNEDPALLVDGIRAGLQEKWDSILDRQFYTRYKRTPTGPEREAARQAYLDRKGIPAGFRTAQEEPVAEPPAE